MTEVRPNDRTGRRPAQADEGASHLERKRTDPVEPRSESDESRRLEDDERPGPRIKFKPADDGRPVFEDSLNPPVERPDPPPRAEAPERAAALRPSDLVREAVAAEAREEAKVEDRKEEDELRLYDQEGQREAEKPDPGEHVNVLL